MGKQSVTLRGALLHSAHSALAVMLVGCYLCCCSCWARWPIPRAALWALHPPCRCSCLRTGGPAMPWENVLLSSPPLK